MYIAQHVQCQPLVKVILQKSGQIMKPCCLSAEAVFCFCLREYDHIIFFYLLSGLFYKVIQVNKSHDFTCFLFTSKNLEFLVVMFTFNNFYKKYQLLKRNQNLKNLDISCRSVTYIIIFDSYSSMQGQEFNTTYQYLLESHRDKLHFLNKHDLRKSVLYKPCNVPNLNKHSRYLYCIIIVMLARHR